MSISDQQVVEATQLHRLSSLSVSTVVTNILLAILLAYIQRSVISPQVVKGWLLLMMLLSLIRIFISQYFIKYPAINSTQTHKRLNIHRLGVITTSAMWGANAFLVLRTHQLEQQLFLIYMLSGLSAGAAVSYTIDRTCALAYVYFAVVPMLISFLFVGGEVPYGMSVAGLVYVFFITYSVIKFNQSLVESVLLRHEADKHQEEIKQLAFYDVLTGLPNRRLLQDRLQHAIAVNQRNGNGGAVLFIDLDEFKKLNDTHGHEKGDALLKQVASRLKEVVRESDTVARLGGDEFVVMLENLDNKTDTVTEKVNRAANEILACLSQPYQLDNLSYYCTPSIGVAMFGIHGNTNDTLLRHADIAVSS
jgi:diguanylate cyclase (GGDEF)-like protein